MGFIAFSVILGRELGYEMGPHKLHCFEYCDVLVSICVMVYIGQCTISSFAMHRTRRMWDRMALKNVLQISARLDESLKAYHASFLPKITQHVSWSKYYSMKDEADFKIIQLMFKTEFHLDPTFDYVMYTKTVLEDNIIELGPCLSSSYLPVLLQAWISQSRSMCPLAANISVSNWMGMIVVFGVFYSVIDQVSNQPAEKWCVWCETEQDQLAALRSGGSSGGGSSRRRRLGGDAAADAAPLCGFLTCDDGLFENGTLSTAMLTSKFAELTSNQTSDKSFTSVAMDCHCPAVYEPPAPQEPTDEVVLLVLSSIGAAVVLMLMQNWIARSLKHRLHLLLKYSGAKHKDDAIPLLAKLEQKFEKIENTFSNAKAMPSFQQLGSPNETVEDGVTSTTSNGSGTESPRGDGASPRRIVKHKTVIRLPDDDADDPALDHPLGKAHKFTDDEAQHDKLRPVLHFTGHYEGKTSRDIMRPTSLRFIMWLTRMIQLVNCFYIGFYACHVQIIVNRAEWQLFDRAEGAVQGIGTLLSLFAVHLALVFPCIYIAWELLPATIRQLSLVGGVLYLNEHAVTRVIAHMEHMANMRNRITKTLLASSFIRSKPDTKKGRAALASVEGERVIMSRISETKHGPDARITRHDMRKVLGEQVTKRTKMSVLRNFLDRDGHERLVAEREDDVVGDESAVGTIDTATTMVLVQGDRGYDLDAEGDNILVTEFQRFLLRSVADACNEASEHGISEDDIMELECSVEDQNITQSDVDHARLEAKAKSMFYSVDKDHSGGVSKEELWKACRKYRIPITGADLNLLFRLIDPDQSGSISVDEWMSFVFSTDEGIAKRARLARDIEMKKNASKVSEAVADACTWKPLLDT